MMPILFEAPRQKVQVAKLAAYCEKLDGTKVRVLRWPREPEGANYPEICNMAFLWSARQLKEPFFWMESDSIPLRPGWLQRIAAAYHAQSRPVMLSIDQQTPHDLISGIGVYDPEFVRTKMPEDGIAGDGWDGWLLKWRRDCLFRSELIQHSYGRYLPEGGAEPWEFPRDRWIVRPSAEIFHADKQQGLIPS